MFLKYNKYFIYCCLVDTSSLANSNKCTGNDFHMSQVMRKRVLCHMRTTKAQISLISAFVVHSSDSIISLVSRSEISRFYLVSVAEQVGLNVTWSQTLEDTFSLDGVHICITLTVRSRLTRQCIFLYIHFYYQIKYCLNQIQTVHLSFQLLVFI